MNISLQGFIRFGFVFRNEFARRVYEYEGTARCFRSSFVPQYRMTPVSTAEHSFVGGRDLCVSSYSLQLTPFLLFPPTLTVPPYSVTLSSYNRIISAVFAVVRLSFARSPQHPRTSEEKEYREL